MFHYFIGRPTAAEHRPAARRGHVPSGITQVEQRAVRESAKQAGAREAYLIEASMAAALGAGLPVAEPGANMIVDIGGGTTEVAVMSLSGIVYCESAPHRGRRDEHRGHPAHPEELQPPRRASATRRKSSSRLGSAYPVAGEHLTMEVKGRDLIVGIPKTILVTGEEIREALREPIMAIVSAVHTCLEQIPPELAADIVDKGIVVSGGGALLRGLDLLLHEQTGLPIRVSDDPLTCVVRGAGALLDDVKLLARVALPS